MTHKKTPWRVNPAFTEWNGRCETPGAILDADGDEVVSTSEWLTIEDVDVRRIFACVNACEGLSTDLLVSITDMGDTLHSRFEARNAEDHQLTATLRRWHAIGQALLNAGITPPADLMAKTAELLGDA